MMKAGRALDSRIASEVLGHPVSQVKREIFEKTLKGTRPLRAYSTDIGAAWEVAERLGITLVPIEDGGWFAFAGKNTGWKSPAEFLACLQTADFLESGAAVSESAPYSICVAALSAMERRRASAPSASSEIQSSLQ